MSSLLPIVQRFLQRDLEPTILIALPAVLRSNTLTFHGTLLIPLHIQPLLQWSLEPDTPTCFPLISFSEKATVENHWVSDTAAGNVSVECLSSMSSSMAMFKAMFIESVFFNGYVYLSGRIRLLRSRPSSMVVFGSFGPSLSSCHSVIGLMAMRYFRVPSCTHRLLRLWGSSWTGMGVQWKL